MRVAMIHTPFPSRGGGERQILRLAIELRKKGHEVEIFTNALNPNAFPEFFKDINIHVIPHPLQGKLPHVWTPQVMPKPSPAQTPLKQQFYVVRWMHRMRERLLRQQYFLFLPAMIQLGRSLEKRFDIINTHNFPTEWAGFVAKSRLKLPWVWMCNEPPYWFFIPEQRERLLDKANWPLYEIVDKTTVNYVDEIMVLSHIAELLIKRTYNRPSTVVRTGVDANPIREANGENVRKQYQLQGKFVILQAGGLNPIKRQHITIGALYELSKRNDRVRLILDGFGQKDTLMALSQKLGIRDKVLFLCSRNDAELAQVYKACDVFVYPSLQSMWGMGLTEAMAAGKPVVVSKLVGVSEIIEDGVNGLLINYPDAKSLADKIGILMDNPSLAAKIGQEASKFVIEKLSWRQYAESVEQVFDKVLAR